MRGLFVLFLGMALNGSAQSYTSYFTGNPSDIEVVPNGGICLMEVRPRMIMGCAGFWNEQMGEMCW